MTDDREETKRIFAKNLNKYIATLIIIKIMLLSGKVVYVVMIEV